MKKKILFLFPLPPPLHGVSMINESIFKSKKIKKQFSTLFINSSTTKNFNEIERFRLFKVLIFFKICIDLICKLNQFKPNLVYLNLSPHGLGFYKDCILVFIIKLFKSKIVNHVHGKGINNEVKNNFLKKKFYRFIFDNMDLICLSKILKKDVEKVKDNSSIIQTINNFSDKIGKSKLKKKINFVYLSNLHPSKGILIFLDAIKILQKKYNRLDFNAKIIGAHFNNKTKEIINKKKVYLKNIFFLGPIYGEKKRLELSSSNVLVFPTRHKNEAFPIVLLEAMSARLGIITSDEGGIPDILTNGIEGIILKNCSANNCALEMLKYLNKKKLIKKHGNAGYQKFLQKFTFQKFEMNMIKSLNTIIVNNDL